MSKKEDTPFVIDFQRRNQSNYGAATPSSSHSYNSNTNSRNGLSSATSSTLYCLHGQTKIEVRDHCHRQRSEGVDIRARKKLIIASALCLLFMICEIVGGILSNSLAIATDAAHLLTDFASFMISLFAIWLAGRPSTQRMSFGWYRAEVIGAMASVVMIWFITAILVWLAVERVINQDFQVDAVIMLTTSGLAIIVNIIMGFQLHHGHSHGGATGPAPAPPIKIETLKTPATEPIALAQTSSAQARPEVIVKDGGERTAPWTSPRPDVDDQKATPAAAQTPTAVQVSRTGEKAASYQNSVVAGEVTPEIASTMAKVQTDSPSPLAHAHTNENLNVRAAFIHVIGDMVQSVGVFLAALLIFFKPEWAIADPICTFIFSIIVLLTTFGIMKDALLVLMEGTPTYLHYTEVLNIFKQIDGVQRVHNLRIWALSINKIALSVHLAVRPGVNPKQILQDATTAVHLRYNFFETTIQIEDFTPDMENCQQCSVPVE